ADVALAAGHSQFAVLTSVQREAAYSGIVAARFSFAGEPLGEQSSRVNLATGCFDNYFKSTYDDDDHLLIAVAPPDPNSGSDKAATTDIESSDLSGASRWAVRVVNAFASASTLSPDGDLWFPYVDIDAIAQNRQGDPGAIGRVTRDGTVCENFNVDGV